MLLISKNNLKCVLKAHFSTYHLKEMACFTQPLCPQTRAHPHLKLAQNRKRSDKLAENDQKRTKAGQQK